MTCDHDLAERERAERAESEARLWLSEYNRLRQEIADATERCVAHLAERDALRAALLNSIAYLRENGDDDATAIVLNEAWAAGLTTEQTDAARAALDLPINSPVQRAFSADVTGDDE